MQEKLNELLIGCADRDYETASAAQALLVTSLAAKTKAYICKATDLPYENHPLSQETSYVCKDSVDYLALDACNLQWDKIYKGFYDLVNKVINALNKYKTPYSYISDLTISPLPDAHRQRRFGFDISVTLLNVNEHIIVEQWFDMDIIDGEN